MAEAQSSRLQNPTFQRAVLGQPSDEGSRSHFTSALSCSDEAPVRCVQAPEEAGPGSGGGVLGSGL